MIKEIVLSISVLTALGAAAADGNGAAARSQVIPRPVSELIQPDKGKFVITESTAIAFGPGLEAQGRYLADALVPATGWDLAVRQGRKGGIVLALDSAAVTAPEGYQLTVTPKGVTITGHDAAGVFYGIQTLLQNLPPQVYGRERQRGVEWSLPAMSVADAPAHPWRGMMLDAARYYYDVDFVKKFIDMMAMYKLNKLQFHVIDDCGWRLESAKYPRLTQVGAWAGEGADRTGGFYTRREVRDLIDYAAVRGVEIVPEIEFPAHILSAIVAYPWLGCTGMQHQVPKQHFISRDLLCVGKQTSMQFLRDILDETIELFPSRYINIGGDEAVYSRWAECPDCRALMRREGLEKPSDLQGWLTNQVAGWMKEKDRTVVGWEEIIMRGKVDTPVVALMWHQPADSVVAVDHGHQAILTPASHLYFDFPESSLAGEPQHAGWMPPISLQKAYSMPVNDYSAGSGVLGVQGCIWSDQFIHGTRLQDLPYLDEDRSERYVEYFVFPRLQAMAELGWTPQSLREYDDFSARMASHYQRMDHADCTYRVPVPQVAEQANADGTFTFTITPNVDGATLRYTTDGTYPNHRSPLYTGPVTVGSRSDFMAINEMSPTHFSLPYLIAPDYSEFDSLGTFTTQWQPLQVQLTPSPWKFECTGKINSNGRWQVTFVNRRGDNTLDVSELKLYKRDELMAVAALSAPGVFTLELTEFEAGTPFHIVATACGRGGNDTSGLVFIKKITD